MGDPRAAFGYRGLRRHWVISHLAQRTQRGAPGRPTFFRGASIGFRPANTEFSVADAAAAKQHLCHVFDVSVGQKGQGGYRVEGNLNMPVTLQAVTSALAVDNALVPAVPADVASAARRYITTTLDVATAAMGNTSINEINRLTTVSNGAIDALFDACGLTR